MHNHASNQAPYGTTRSAVGAVKGFHSSLNRNHLGGRKRKNVLLGFGHASPDGKQIAFFGGMPGKPWKVYLIAAEGGEPQQLLADELNEGDPSWSPDGASLAFGRLPWKTGTTESSEIYIMDLKSHRRTTVPGSNGLFSPRWSPNGNIFSPRKPIRARFCCSIWSTKSGLSSPRALWGIPVGGGIVTTFISRISIYRIAPRLHGFALRTEAWKRSQT